VIKEKNIILKMGNICDHCLGRQFKNLFPKKTSALIGAAVRKGKNDKEIKKLMNEKLAIDETQKCFVCAGLFQRIDDAVELILEKMKHYEFDTFLVGCAILKKIQAMEEEIWAKIGGENVEPIKKELNIILRRKLLKKIGKKIDLNYPDIIFLADFVKNRILVNMNSLFIEGRYQKLVRDLPQTKWPGKEYNTSVEELVAESVLKATQATREKFHGQGREDLNALMLGKGRPFVIEIRDPKKRKINLKKVQKEINEKNKNKIKVTNFKFATKKRVIEIKSEKFDKTYRCLIETEKKVDKKKLKELDKFFTNKEIAQKTPTRSLGHRADKKRKRKVKKLKTKYLDTKKFEINVIAEAGTYIKELISGDKDRTKPSITEFLDNECKCIELDVIKISD